MRKSPDQDKSLHDHIKELWTAWSLEEDEFLVNITNFTEFLAGYFAYYYKGDNTSIEFALEYFSEQIDEWVIEDDASDPHDDTDAYEVF